ncbi:MAG TPA: glycosyltransferase family 39 protein [Accumulibacter sp.]|nr:glycosyltransferase family 39 protein [Accumulibacter sp.]
MRRFLVAIGEGVLETRAATLLILCALWLTLFAGFRPLMLPDEGRYVGVAWEMLSSGNWLVPTLDGMPFFHKPPLFYWLTAAGLQVFGANDWAARLASTLAALLATVALYAFLRRYADKRLANLAVVVLVSQPMFFAGAQYANLDMLVAAMISATIVCGASAILSLERGLPYRIALASAYFFAALGVLAKGLIGFVLPGAILLAWLLVRRRYRLIPALLPIPMIVLFLFLALPWFVWMQASYGGFWDYFLVYHHFRRFAETGFNNAQAFWFYVPVLLVGTLPWSPWIVRVFSLTFLADRERLEVRSLMIVWLLGIVIFFSLPSSKLVGYIFPALPPLACLLADALLGWLDKRSSGTASVSGTPSAASTSSAWPGVGVVVASSACVVFIVLVALFDRSSSKALAKKVAPLFATGDQIVMVDEYQYDLPFYLRAATNPWVVSDWSDPDIQVRDNWRKELYDAGRFDPPLVRDRLLLAGDFASRACADSGGTLWVFGKTAQASAYPFLPEQAIAFADGKRTVWKLDAGQRRQLSLCAEKPSSG